MRRSDEERRGVLWSRSVDLIRISKLWWFSDFDRFGCCYRVFVSCAYAIRVQATSLWMDSTTCGEDLIGWDRSGSDLIAGRGYEMLLTWNLREKEGRKE